MIRRYGIDTSVLVRLLTGDPEKDFASQADHETGREQLETRRIV